MLGQYVVDEASCLTFGEVASPLLFYAGLMDEPFVPIDGDFSLLTVEPAEVSVQFQPQADFVGKLFVIYRDLTIGGMGFEAPVTTAAKFAFEMVEVPATIPEEGFALSLFPLEFEDDPALPGFGPPPAYDQLGEELLALLLEQGLSPEEAAAFMTAWQKIFFGADFRDGHPSVPSGPTVFIIGIHSQADYDQLIPITLTPPPEELVRVLVSYTML